MYHITPFWCILYFMEHSVRVRHYCRFMKIFRKLLSIDNLMYGIFTAAVIREKNPSFRDFQTKIMRTDNEGCHGRATAIVVTKLTSYCCYTVREICTPSNAEKSMTQGGCHRSAGLYDIDRRHYGHYLAANRPMGIIIILVVQVSRQTVRNFRTRCSRVGVSTGFQTVIRPRFVRDFEYFFYLIDTKTRQTY